jgi:hypothetical protein
VLVKDVADDEEVMAMVRENVAHVQQATSFQHELEAHSLISFQIAAAPFLPSQFRVGGRFLLPSTLPCQPCIFLFQQLHAQYVEPFLLPTH